MGVKHVPEEEKELAWYVIHTYSGYENKVMDSLIKTVENRNLQDQIPEIVVPIEEIVRVKNGKPTPTKHKLYPGYVFVRMKMSSSLWYIVRNTRGCTGFVGPASKPIPLSDEEAADMLNAGGKKVVYVDFEVGDEVELLDERYKSFFGVIKEIDEEDQKLKVVIYFMEKEIMIDTSFEGVKKLVPIQD